MVTNTNVSSGEITSALAGVNYPAEKQILIKKGKKHGSDDVVSALNGLPEKQYISESDVMMELGIDTPDNA